MVKEKIDVKDFEKISEENEFFLWHFTAENTGTAIRSIFEIEDYRLPNPMNTILEQISIPYFESKIENSYNFVMNLGDNYLKNCYKNGFQPVIVGFHKRRAVTSTYKECYCPDGIINLIWQLNPKFILDANV
jgi:hypothetical protein